MAWVPGAGPAVVEERLREHARLALVVLALRVHLRDATSRSRKWKRLAFRDVCVPPQCSRHACEMLIMVESFARGELAADWTNILSNPRADFRFY